MSVPSIKTLLFALLTCVCCSMAAAAWFEIALLSDLTLQTKLESGQTGDSYASGEVVIIGNTAAVSSGQGVYLYARTNETWTQKTVLVPSDGFSGCDSPRDIALLQDVLFLGCAFKTVDGKSSQGAVYVFKRIEETWIEAQRLTSADGASGDQFGRTLSADGDRLIVGAHGHMPRGAAYIFFRNPSGWVEESKLTPTDEVIGFGQGVWINGDTVAVFKRRNTTDPAVYLFSRSLGDWESQGSVSVCEPSACCCNFGGIGKSFALKGDTLVVGNSYLNVGNNSAQGGAYVFTRANGAWAQTAKLIAEDGQSNSLFGASAFVVSDAKLIIGAQGDFTENGGIHGTVYIYEKETGMWAAKQTLHSDGPVNHRDDFGSRLYFDSDSLIVAAPVLKGTGPFVGAAFIFSAPAALKATVSGRVMTPAGLGLRNATVWMIDAEGERRTTLTSTLGYFTFTEVPTGESYGLGAASRRYRFETRMIEIMNDLNDIELVGLE